MGSRAVALVCASAEVAAAGSAQATAGPVSCTPVPDGRSSATSSPSSCWPGCARPSPRPGSGTSWRPTGCCSTASCCPGRPRPRTCCGTQYAAVGAAARAALPAAVDVLGQAAARGADVGDLLARTTAAGGQRRGVHRLVPPLRLADRWPRRGAGRAVPAAGDRGHAPTATATTAGTSASPTAWWRPTRRSYGPTRRLAVDTTVASSVEAGIAWWEELTGGRRRRHGGQAAWPTSSVRPRASPQPGIKVRGREYLRIIYGPDYTEPANLERLRPRTLGHKLSLAVTRVRPGRRVAGTSGAGRAVVARARTGLRRARARVRTRRPAALRGLAGPGKTGQNDGQGLDKRTVQNSPGQGTDIG